MFRGNHLKKLNPTYPHDSNLLNIDQYIGGTWIGLMLRKERSRDCMVALGWRPEGRRAVGRPRKTWRRTVQDERLQAGCDDMNIIDTVARDTAQCKEIDDGNASDVIGFW